MSPWKCFIEGGSAPGPGQMIHTGIYQERKKHTCQMTSLEKERKEYIVRFLIPPSLR